MNSMDNIFKQKLFEHKSGVRPELWDRIEQSLDTPVPVTGKNTRIKWITGILLLLFISTCAYIAIDSPLKSVLITEQNFNNEPGVNKSFVPAITNDLEQETEKNQENQLELIQTTPLNEEEVDVFYNNEKIVDDKLMKSNEVIQKPTEAVTNSSANFIIEEKTEAKKSNNEILVVSPPISKTLQSIPNLESKLSLLESEKSFDLPLFGDPTECPAFGVTNRPRFFLEPYVSSDYAIRSLQARTQEMESYRQLRDNSESSLYSYAVGLRASMMLGSGLTVKSGFVYTQINEKFIYEDPDAIQTRTIITIDTVFNMGVPEVTRDTSYIQIGGTQFIKTFNKYKMIDIPVIVGYEMNMGRYNLSINAGAYFNLKFTQKGRFLAPDGSPQTFTTNTSGAYPAFKTSVGMSLYGSVALYYELTDFMDLMIEPRIRYYMNPISLDSYPLEQSYVTGGLITGLRFKF